MAGERKPVFGKGVNDAPPGEHSTKYYKTWQNMLKRCYCPNYQAKQPTYRDCVVCDKWLVYSNFRDWMKEQDWRGKELDKDLIDPGNREYSQSKCMFVSRQINSLINERKTGRELPQGVWFDHGAGRYRAEFTANGKKRYIGLFDAPEDAGDAYKKAKADHIRSMAREQDGRLYKALMDHAQIMDPSWTASPAYFLGTFAAALNGADPDAVDWDFVVEVDRYLNERDEVKVMHLERNPPHFAGKPYTGDPEPE